MTYDPMRKHRRENQLLLGGAFLIMIVIMVGAFIKDMRRESSTIPVEEAIIRICGDMTCTEMEKGLYVCEEDTWSPEGDDGKGD